MCTIYHYVSELCEKIADESVLVESAKWKVPVGLEVWGVERIILDMSKRLSLFKGAMFSFA